MTKSFHRWLVYANFFLLIGLGFLVNWPWLSVSGGNVEPVKEPFGFIDKSGNLVIDLQRLTTTDALTLFSDFSDGLCIATTPGGDDLRQPTKSRCNYLSSKGNFINSSLNVVEGRRFSEGLAAVNLTKSPEEWPHFVDGEWWFIDKTGAKKLGPFGKVEDFSQGLAAVRLKKSKVWQYVDRCGSVRILGQFSVAGPFVQCRAPVSINGKWGLIDSSGNLILPPTYENRIGPFHGGLAAVPLPTLNRVDYLDTDGKVRFKLARTFIPYKPGRVNDVSVSGEKLGLRLGFDSEFGFAGLDVSEGLVVIEKNGKFGYSDLRGRTVIAPRFDYCWPFSGGRGRVLQVSSNRASFGYVNHSGKEVIPCTYSKASDFSEGFAIVVDHSARRSFYIDHVGRNIFGKTFSRASAFNEGKALVGPPFICY